jgi:hypothetical protein
LILAHTPKLIKFLSFGSAQAIALCPFILLSDKESAEFLIRHEKIHIRQQLELLIIPFYIWYVVEFLIKLIKYKNRHLAYLNISFEQEAYCNHFASGFLKKRKRFNFINYL